MHIKDDANVVLVALFVLKLFVLYLLALLGRRRGTTRVGLVRGNVIMKLRIVEALFSLFSYFSQQSPSKCRRRRVTSHPDLRFIISDQWFENTEDFGNWIFSE